MEARTRKPEPVSAREPILVRFSRVQRAAVRAEWRAAEAAGLEMEVRDDGDTLLGAAPSIASTMFNRGLGFAERPDRVRAAVAFFETHRVAGDIVLDRAGVPPGVEPRLALAVHVAAPGGIHGAPVEGLTIRAIDVDAADAWMSVAIAANLPAPAVASLWRSMAPHVAATPGWKLFVGDLDGRAVAAASLFVTDAVGWLSWASVLPAERGRGIQRAMIAARAQAAVDMDCDLVAAWALAGAHSSANLEAAGFRNVAERVVVRAGDLP